MKVLYGSNSWMTHLTNEDFAAVGVKTDVDVEYIDKAGHHIYADQYQQFNLSLNNFLQSIDWPTKNVHLTILNLFSYLHEIKLHLVQRVNNFFTPLKLAQYHSYLHYICIMFLKPVMLLL